jgi:putative transposase
MPWKEMSPVEQKRRLIALVHKGVLSMTDAAEQSGVHRKTGHKWLKRFEEDGTAGLEERSRAPKHSPQARPDEERKLVLDLKQRRPSWGPKKIVAALKRQGLPAPAASTAGTWLDEAGLVQPRRRQLRPSATPTGLEEAKGPNDLWCIDFKGQFRLGNGQLCYPLTVTDQYSRYLLGCDALATTSTEGAKRCVERLFCEYGLPRAIRSDNGTPFASLGLAGLSTLCVSWLKQGIRLERIPPGKPQHNGRHERMHRTLKAETTRPPAATMQGQQRLFDVFRPDFNMERPHEALDMDVPSKHYEPSPRCFRASDDATYPGHFEVRRVRREGTIKWAGTTIYISQSLVGEQLGLNEIDDGVWQISFLSLVIAGIDMRNGKPQLIR